MRSRAGQLAVTVLFLGCGSSVDVDEPNETSRGVGATSAQSSASSSSGTGGASSSSSSTSGTGGAGVGGAGGTMCTDSVPLDEAIAAFGACMSLADWIASGLGELADTPTVSNGPCTTCHASGIGGVKLSGGDAAAIAETFEAHRVPPQIFELVEGVGDPACIVDLAPSHGYDDINATSPEHPPYLVPPDIQQGLEQFFDLTYTKWQMGPCMADP